MELNQQSEDIVLHNESFALLEYNIIPVSLPLLKPVCP